MFHAVWRVLRHPQDAEDALQSALGTIWRKRAQIERHPAPQALIMKICADAAIDQFRRRRRNKQEALASFESGLASAEPGPLDEAIDHETLELVMEGIARLSPNQASAMVMRFVEGQSHAAISAALGCGVETVREHLTRGRERLGRMLGSLAPRVKTRPSNQNQPCAEE
jgi:RNA polymerase sigma-70 factor (ECF subfamily)